MVQDAFHATRLGLNFGVKCVREQHYKGRPQKYNNYNLSSEALLVVGGWGAPRAMSGGGVL